MENRTMTKEELKQEAEEYYEDETEGTFQICEDCYWFADAVKTAYVDSAEPREKQIQIDAEHIRALQKQNGELTDKVRELEKENEKLKGDLELWESGACKATNLDKCGVVKELETQIEKMKNCGNCKNEGDYKEPYRYGTGWCNICKRHKVAKGNFDKWEIKEK